MSTKTGTSAADTLFLKFNCNGAHYLSQMLLGRFFSLFSGLVWFVTVGHLFVMLVAVLVGCGCLASAWWVFIGVDFGSGVMRSQSKFMQIRGQGLGEHWGWNCISDCAALLPLVIISPHWHSSFDRWASFGNVLEKKLEAEEYIKQCGAQAFSPAIVLRIANLEMSEIQPKWHEGLDWTTPSFDQSGPWVSTPTCEVQDARGDKLQNCAVSILKHLETILSMTASFDMSCN